VVHPFDVSQAASYVRPAGYKQQMDDEEFKQAVRRLRAEGCAPKEIARALGVRPAVVAPLVRLIAAERTAAEVERKLVGCWVSPGWRVGLRVSGHREWPDGDTAYPETGGLVGVLIAREDRNQQISICGYLLDVYCLGVKNVLGPERMRRGDLSSFSRSFFSGWAAGGVPAPIELARELVLGVAKYAHTLGFRPHADFEQARGHLGEWEGPGAIRFGCEGTPTFTEGPYDDAVVVLRTLEESVGAGNFHFTVSACSYDSVSIA
jgi:hypothetical protein